MANLKHQLKELFTEIPKYLIRSAYGLSFEDDKRIEAIAKVLQKEKLDLILGRAQQKVRLPWEQIMEFAYRYGQLPTEKEIFLVHQYGMSLFARLKNLNKL